MSRLLEDIVGELSKLPGVGKRTALRLAMHLLRREQAESDALALAISDFRHKIRHCSLCNNLCDEEVCPVCRDASRDRGVICVVEHAADLISIENSRQYNGLYHVLGGVISPMMGIGPGELKVDLLAERVAAGQIREVILAISTTVEGETTLFYITRRLEAYPDVKVTAIARGIGFGDQLEYADELTIAHAIRNRTGV